MLQRGVAESETANASFGPIRRKKSGFCDRTVWMLSRLSSHLFEHILWHISA